jgi:putative membrane protein
MQRFVVRVIVNAVAFWLTTVIIGTFSSTPGISVNPYGAKGVVETVLTYLLVALIFGLVNGIIGNFIRIVAFPLYVLTLGLLALVVNALLLLLVSWISGQIGFGLSVRDFFWGVIGALVLGIISWLLGIVLRPILGSPKKR